MRIEDILNGKSIRDIVLTENVGGKKFKRRKIREGITEISDDEAWDIVDRIDFGELNNWIKEAFGFGRTSILVDDVSYLSIYAHAEWYGLDGQYMQSYLYDTRFGIEVYGEIYDRNAINFIVKYNWKDNPEGEEIAEAEYNVDKKKWKIKGL